MTISVICQKSQSSKTDSKRFRANEQSNFSSLEFFANLSFLEVNPSIYLDHLGIYRLH